MYVTKKSAKFKKEKNNKAKMSKKIAKKEDKLIIITNNPYERKNAYQRYNYFRRHC